MSTKREREELITSLAFKMAESGKFHNFQHIEIALRADGHGEARSVLDHRATRDLMMRYAGPEESATMPTGPKGEKRPADVIGNAVKVMRIATGD
jgi:hypothetical protein